MPEMIVTAHHPGTCQQCGELKDQVRITVRAKGHTADEEEHTSPGRTHWAYYVNSDPQTPTRKGE